MGKGKQCLVNLEAYGSVNFSCCSRKNVDSHNDRKKFKNNYNATLFYCILGFEMQASCRVILKILCFVHSVDMHVVNRRCGRRRFVHYNRRGSSCSFYGVLSSLWVQEDSTVQCTHYNSDIRTNRSYLYQCPILCYKSIHYGG